jgi:ligand-binding sensor domain-containing protein
MVLQQNSFYRLRPSQNYIKTSVQHILTDKVGNLWVASNQGNNLLDTLGGLWFSSATINAKEKTFTKI